MLSLVSFFLVLLQLASYSETDVCACCGSCQWVVSGFGAAVVEVAVASTAVTIMFGCGLGL